MGPNGAGKTTVMKMIYCVSPVTAGEIEVKGMNVKERSSDIKRIIGVAPQNDNLDPDFTVIKNLLVYARYFDIPPKLALKRGEKLLEFFHLTEKRDVIIMHLSGGMRKRLLLARALINNPEILILDEPTVGLDIQARNLIWERIRQLKESGVTILLTTHYMEEAMRLCERIAIMDGGKIIVHGEPLGLIKEYFGGEDANLEDLFLKLTGRKLRD